MTKRSNRTKREQIRALINLYRRHPQARRTALDIAGELDCDVSTVTRYIAELRDTDEFVLKRDRDNCYYIPEKSHVPLGELDLTLHERAALYLAARLLQQITDERNDHVATALSELVGAMPSTLLVQLEPLILAEGLRGASSDIGDMSDIFATVVEGWTDRRVVDVMYRPYYRSGATPAVRLRFAPYLLEPVAMGRAIYMIGAILPSGDIRTLKLERVDRATLLDETFTVPDDFDGQALLARAWGVMYGSEGKSVAVRLRFTQAVRRRVRETLWHPSQRITDLPDGGCEWVAEIGDITEIGPWVRGWGSDCEVLEPEELRISVRHHVRRLAEIYDCLPPAIPTAPGEISTEVRNALNDLFG